MYIDELMNDLKSRGITLTDRSKLTTGAVVPIDPEFPFNQHNDGRVFYHNSTEISHEDIGKLVAGYPGANACVLISRRSNISRSYKSMVFGRSVEVSSC